MPQKISNLKEKAETKRTVNKVGKKQVKGRKVSLGNIFLFPSILVGQTTPDIGLRAGLHGTGQVYQSCLKER